ncbi:MAG: hemolysin III family protein [Spirochaetaceae bacterium]|jgi:hemolysin III|nr:hemolysin III family protein [Spirochaetaceae bacterium]
MTPTKIYSPGEEICNAVTHGVGVCLGIAALALLLARATGISHAGETALYVTSAAIYGGALVILFLMSTLYHGLTHRGAKGVFAVLDHSSIYLLIAGTYTPFCLTVLRGVLGWVLLGLIWALAVGGIACYSVFRSRMRVLSVVTYVVMGWMIVFASKPLFQVLPPASAVLLVAGGAAYTAGCVFYAVKRKWFHAVWHLFVLAGGACHFLAIYGAM